MYVRSHPHHMRGVVHKYNSNDLHYANPSRPVPFRSRCGLRLFSLGAQVLHREAHYGVRKLADKAMIPAFLNIRKHL